MRKKHEIFFLVDFLVDFLADFLADKVVFFQVCLRVCFRVYFLATRAGLERSRDFFSRTLFYCAKGSLPPLSCLT